MSSEFYAGSALQNQYAFLSESSKEVLWRALEVDPNQENGLGWYEVIHRERAGEQAGLEALKRVAAVPDSWRAQLWLARAELQSRRLERALALYAESFARVEKPVPADMLMQVSGDLVNAGHSFAGQAGRQS